jgi:hypothetical protein
MTVMLFMRQVFRKYQHLSIDAAPGSLITLVSSRIES